MKKAYEKSKGKINLLELAAMTTEECHGKTCDISDED